MNRRTAKSLIGSRSLLWALLVVASVLGAACPPPPKSPLAAAGDFVIGVSPFLPEAEVPAVRGALFRMILERIHSGSRVTVFDAYHLRRITDINIPPNESFNLPKVRSKHLRQHLLAIQRFLDASVLSGAGEGEVDGQIRLPQFLDLIASSRVEETPTATVVLLGGALYLDPRDGRFSMENGRYPADDRLCVARKESVFGVADRRGQLKGARVHYAYLGDPWIDDLHEEPVRRFWSLFIRQQGGELITFARDLPTVIDRMGKPDAHSPWSYELDCPRPLKIGIRWSCLGCDLDLYSRPAAGAAELFYRNPKTGEGIHFKDYLTSPTPVNAREWIEYLGPVNVVEVEAAVNFYRGQSAGGVSGEVLVQIGEGTYEGPFRIAASEGNGGAESDSRADSRHWAVLDIGSLVALGKKSQRAENADAIESQRPPEGFATSPEAPPAATRSNGRQTSREPGTERGVRILSPQDGSVIRARGGSPLEHWVDGNVYGFDQDEIERFHLMVEVSIFTDRWHDQGIAEVRKNGTWETPAWFGGARHIVRAVLKDGSGNEIHSHEVNVTVVRQ